MRIPSANTTPESTVLQKTFRDMADAGMQAVVMEVSSQALMLHRTAGFVFDLGIFTNLSPDHIGPNEHSDFEDYLHCKSLLFRQCRTGIFNGDDPYFERILEGHTCEVETFGLGEGNDLRAKNISLIHTPGELGIAFDTEGVLSLHAHVPAPGSFSVYNALCAIAVCRHFDVSEDNICRSLSRIHVRGRIEMVKVSDKFTLMIDYAHNAMALESLLKTLREYDPGRLVCLFGCGGNRARSRRFEMGEVSGRLADFTIITSDNPRFEEPMDIIADIVTGIAPTGGKYIEIPDRKEAIRYAIENGQPHDIIVLAGKGHEDYQEIRGKKYPMDERVLIEAAENEFPRKQRRQRGGGIDMSAKISRKGLSGNRLQADVTGGDLFGKIRTGDHRYFPERAGQALHLPDPAGSAGESPCGQYRYGPLRSGQYPAQGVCGRLCGPGRGWRRTDQGDRTGQWNRTRIYHGG